MISDLNTGKQRLIECFAAVFPTLGEEQMAHTTQALMPEWDSLATATLVTVIEDEFDIEISPENLEDLVSFNAFWNYLANAEVSSAPRS